jgi:hypothetical protein
VRVGDRRIVFKQTGGIANNFGGFFLSGLPGAIDIMLVLMYEGTLDKRQMRSGMYRMLGACGGL